MHRTVGVANEYPQPNDRTFRPTHRQHLTNLTGSYGADGRVSMISLGLGAMWAVGLAAAAANSATGGPDYIGLAALISAGAGAVGTLVMSYLALVRRRSDVPLTPEQMAEAFREAMKDNKP